MYIRFASLRTGLCALAAALALFVGCSSPHDNALAEYSRWYDGAVAQAGALTEAQAAAIVERLRVDFARDFLGTAD